jgi:hypothetical protein
VEIHQPEAKAQQRCPIQVKRPANHGQQDRREENQPQQVAQQLSGDDREQSGDIPKHDGETHLWLCTMGTSQTPKSQTSPCHFG